MDVHVQFQGLRDRGIDGWISNNWIVGAKQSQVMVENRKPVDVSFPHGYSHGTGIEHRQDKDVLKGPVVVRIGFRVIVFEVRD